MQAYPRLVEELRAVAKGAGVGPDDMVVANLAAEIQCVAASQGTPPLSCCISVVFRRCSPHFPVFS